MHAYSIVRRLAEMHAHWYRHERFGIATDIMSTIPTISDQPIIDWTLMRYIRSYGYRAWYFSAVCD
jgi:hypothetical protein